MNSHFIENVSDEKDLEANLLDLSADDSARIVFSTSFGMEDQVISHAILSQKLTNIRIFTLDTGRLFPETYSTWDKTLLQYNATIQAFNPNTEAVEKYVNTNGINPFYTSQDLRKQCCHIRKVEPLKRALNGADVWITGLRAEQSDNRQDLKLIQWDETYQLYKYNPLLNWTSSQVTDYITKNAIPYNPLHDSGFVSIGCAPCTRAINEGEDFRAGRWWWENQSKKECGLHR